VFGTAQLMHGVLFVVLHRYFTDPEERASVKASVDSFVDSVTGKK
jgi:hypothetical protein